jgi:hypothetical protein
MVGDAPVAVYAPEDILVQKLVWFRMTDETSERQWRDILGILHIARETLDHAYLASAAASFGVSDLLERAYADKAHP